MTNTIKYIFWVMRTFTDTSDTVIDYYGTSKTARIIYTILTNIFLLSAEGMSAFKNLTFTNPLTLELNLLNLLNSFLSCSCFVANIIIVLDWNNQISLALNHLQTYDSAAKFPKRSHYYQLNFLRIDIIIVLLHSIVIVSMKHQVTRAFFELFVYWIYIEFNLQILNFCGLMLSIYQRFHHLNYIISGKGEMERKIVSISYTPNDIESQRAWWLHWHLARATEIINQIWSIQLFLWICKLFLNVIFRIYKILNEPKYLTTVYGAVIASSSFFQLCILVICCHLATIQGNKVVQNMFSPMRILHNKDEITLQSDMLANAYFCTRKIHFTAIGLIRIRLPLIISIIGVMTTYLVILYKSPKQV